MSSIWMEKRKISGGFWIITNLLINLLKIKGTFLHFWHDSYNDCFYFYPPLSFFLSKTLIGEIWAHWKSLPLWSICMGWSILLERTVLRKSYREAKIISLLRRAQVDIKRLEISYFFSLNQILYLDTEIDLPMQK